MTTREDIRSDLALPPGEYLAEVLGELGMSQADLARRMGRPPQAINEIMRGNKALTPETALQLEHVVGVPAHVWIGLESEYRLVAAEQAEMEQVKKETRLLTAFPYKEMAKLGCVATTRRAEEKVKELHRFFGVASLERLGQITEYAPAFRLGGGDRQPSAFGLAAWLRCGYLQARDVDVAPFSETKLEAAIQSLRALTLTPPTAVDSDIRTILAGCGVVFALFPHFPKTYAQGATFWLEPKKKAVLLSSIRGKWTDIFWFSFFHELGHILLHGNTVFVELDRSSQVRSAEEQQADDFASDVLLPPADYHALRVTGDFKVDAVTRFATSVAIHPGVVVGRLQHDKVIEPTQLNFLRGQYTISHSQGESAA